MRKRDWVILGVSLVTIGLVWKYQPQTNKVEIKEEQVSMTARRKIYNKGFSEYETLRKKAELYENYMFAYQLGYRTDPKKPQQDGKFTNVSDFNALYGVDVPEGYTFALSYYYDQDKKYLTQVIVVAFESKSITNQFYTVFNEDMLIVNQFDLSERAYL